ncbi:ABC transporter permease subunit [Acetobacter sacchari]|uniref:ABC transporter permease subunit n=1 Tax=Acetobacter sacchari TaxID=2661687 RepID=A0ABS3LV06_9PROT|nr:ABC transporter permease subunit [Acetobacter sacchari]MBO1359757.1 ABC transporter permease subunit [Acetobacter sacchari]
MTSGEPAFHPGRIAVFPRSARALVKSLLVDLSAPVFLAGMAILAAVFATRWLPVPSQPPRALNLTAWAAPLSAALTVSRMAIALLLALVVTGVCAPLAASGGWSGAMLTRLTRAARSVPTLGRAAFLTPLFLALSSRNGAGAEFAAIIATAGSVAPDAAFAMILALRGVPAELDLAARGIGLTAWQRFWRLEAPCSIPPVCDSLASSLPGAWFTLLFTENLTWAQGGESLPGIGSYVAAAATQAAIQPIILGGGAMLVIALACNKLGLRLLRGWATRYRLGDVERSDPMRDSALFRTLRLSPFLRPAARATTSIVEFVARLRIGGRPRAQHLSEPPAMENRAVPAILLTGGAVAALCGDVLIPDHHLFCDFLHIFFFGLLTTIRVVALIALISLFWTPVGVWLARRSVSTQIVGVCAMFPANLLYPLIVGAAIYAHVHAGFWLAALPALGAQWLFLAHILRGIETFPEDLLRAACAFNVRGGLWWRKVMLPGLAPAWLGGVVAAANAAWNASIAAELVRWGGHDFELLGVGGYITHASMNGDMTNVALGIAAMTFFASSSRRLIWAPLTSALRRRHTSGAYAHVA